MENKNKAGSQELPQEKEFRAWGLSRIAVRNIVVFFIVCLLSAIGALARVIVEMNDERKVLQEELLKSKDQAAVKIEQLKNENIENYYRLSDLFQKQHELREELQKAKARIKELSEKQ